MKFKDPRRLKKEWWEISPLLRLILCDAEWYSIQYFDEELTLTCLMRTAEEQADLVKRGASTEAISVHQFGRGGDARLLKNAANNLILQSYINHKYEYDPLRPHFKTVVRHGGTAEHLHFQTLQ